MYKWLSIVKTIPHISKPHFAGGPLGILHPTSDGTSWVEQDIFFVGILADEVVWG